jgi:hypothetical protein
MKLTPNQASTIIVEPESYHTELELTVPVRNTVTKARVLKLGDGTAAANRCSTEVYIRGGQLDDLTSVAADTCDQREQRATGGTDDESDCTTLNFWVDAVSTSSERTGSRAECQRALTMWISQQLYYSFEQVWLSLSTLSLTLISNMNAPRSYAFSSCLPGFVGESARAEGRHHGRRRRNGVYSEYR